ncbi:hypothetical protein [Brevibacterium ammoniilyticum]|uniref:hypothetical protein n=1 Tax=Brevibacterium ammoniilyticum TaxID=1046555 RepID=UPI003139A577
MKIFLVSIRDQVLWQARSHGALFIAVVGVIAGLVPMVPWLPRYLLFALSLLGVLIGIIALYWEGSSLNRRFRAHELVERNPVFGQVLPHDDDLPDRFFSPRGSIVYDRDLNSSLLNDLEIEIQYRSRYRLPRDLKEIAPYILRRTTAGSWHFNGPCVGMAGDLRTDGALVIPFREAGFFDHLCSNELMRWRLRRGEESWDLPQRYLYDSERRLIPLASSELANVIGVSTFALSTDDKVLIVEQTARNHSSQGLLAPSGSGSLEPEDHSVSLAPFILNGANRELLEETGITDDQIRTSHLIGFGRWLERGAKPEFFAVTLLNDSAANIEERRGAVSRSEAHYTRRTRWIELADLIEPDEDTRSIMSVPLGYGALALRDALDNRHTVFEAH